MYSLYNKSIQGAPADTATLNEVKNKMNRMIYTVKLKGGDSGVLKVSKQNTDVKMLTGVDSY